MVEAFSSPASYVERVEERQRYLDFLTRDTPWVMLITGLEGNGKSEFLDDIKKHTPLDDTSVVPLNFAVPVLQQDAISILERLVRRIERYCDESFVTMFKARVEDARRQLSSLDFLIVQQNRAGNYGHISQTDQKIILDITEYVPQQRQQIRSMVTTAFYNVLKSFSLNQLVILLDSCEWLDEAENSTPESIEVSRWLLDELLPEVHDFMQVQQKRCFVVIASSVPLAFNNIPNKEFLFCNLDKLDKVAVDHYMEQNGILEANLRDYIYEHMTYGHACSIWIIGDIAQHYGPFEYNDRSRLEMLFRDYAMHVFINQHIFEKLSNSPFRKLIHYGTLLHSFDQPLLEAVFPEWMSSTEPFRRFQRLIRYPYVLRLNNGRFTFIDLMREVLVPYIRKQEPEKWQRAHEKAFRYLESVTHPDQYYHAFIRDELEGLKSWKQALDDAFAKNSRQEIAALLEVAHDETLSLSTAASAERSYQEGRFYEYNGQYKEALECYTQARQFFSENGDASGGGRMQQMIDDVQQRLNSPTQKSM